MSTWSLEGLWQNLSLETIIVCTVVCCFPHDNTALKSLAKRLVQFVTARASLFTDHGVSGLPVRGK